MTLGYTSSKAPPSLEAANGSYWPRIPDATNASTAPVCAPVMRPETTPRGFLGPPVITPIASAAARIQPDRSTMRASGTAPLVCRPVTSSTGGSAALAAVAKLSITWRRVQSGDGGPGPGQPLADRRRESPVDSAPDGQLR